MVSKLYRDVCLYMPQPLLLHSFLQTPNQTPKQKISVKSPAEATRRPICFSIKVNKYGTYLQAKMICWSKMEHRNNPISGQSFQDPIQVKVSKSFN